MTEPQTRDEADQLTPAQRVELGRAARASAPRSAHGSYEPASDRPDPIDLFEAQEATRVPELIPIRHARMLASPFTFYRGAAVLMANDLAGTPCSGFEVQLCGDAHVSNFGLFGSAERSLVFDINDFDETLPGPWEWDVKRLAASLAIAAREIGVGPLQRPEIVETAVGGYRTRMGKLAEMGELDVWYSSSPVDKKRVRAQVAPALTRQAHEAVAKARTRDHLQAFERLTEVVDGRLRLASEPPILIPISQLVGAAEAQAHERRLDELIRPYFDSLEASRHRLVSRFRYVDMARKVVGVGSIGMRAWVCLLVGRDQDDPILMQVKEATASVLEPYAGPSPFTNAGQRVVTGQRLMQASGDILLGWVRSPGPDGVECDYYVRQLRDWKGSAPIEKLRPAALAEYGRICGAILARAHARSGDRIAIAAYLGKGSAFDRALGRFAEAYADQNERDYLAMREAVATGRLEASPDW